MNSPTPNALPSGSGPTAPNAPGGGSSPPVPPAPLPSASPARDWFGSSDPKTQFAAIAVFLAAATILAHALLLGWLTTELEETSVRVKESTRIANIVKQDWWLEEDKTLADEVQKVRQRFWSGETIGLVRAELEKRVQTLMGRHGLQASGMLIETRPTDHKGISLITTQLKFQGKTQGLLAALSELAADEKDVFLSRVTFRIFQDLTNVEVTFDAPIAVVGGDQAQGTAPPEKAAGAARP